MKIELARPGKNGGRAIWRVETIGTLVKVSFGKEGAKLATEEYPNVANPAAKARQLAQKKLSQSKGYELIAEIDDPPPAPTSFKEYTLKLAAGERTHAVLLQQAAIFDMKIADLEEEGGCCIGSIADALWAQWYATPKAPIGLMRLRDTGESSTLELAFVAAVAHQLRLNLTLKQPKVPPETPAPEDLLDELRRDLPANIVTLLQESGVLDDGNLLVGAFA